MNSLWTQNEICRILLQLEQRGALFPGYSFRKNDDGLSLLGQGSHALVFEGVKRPGKTRCAIKVIGFGGYQALAENFASVLENQKRLGWESRHIVRIYDYAQLRVWIDDGGGVTKVQPLDKADSGGQFLDLQFVVMEKLSPVLSPTPLGQPRLCNQALTDMDEGEILHLAKDISDALERTHRAGMLHRDVKLENLFYDPRKKIYKLGDFGIAKAAKDGMASTVAFTKGYGAPEVLFSGMNRYDCTADIYSFGMLLYVLLNGLRFPGSSGYYVNAEVQYQKGYLLSPPVSGAEELFAVVEKMCRYLPDDRYQSMDAVVKALFAADYTPVLHYRDDHREAFYLLGTAMAAVGLFFFRVCFPPEGEPGFSWEFLLLLALGLVCVLLEKGRQNGAYLRFGILCIGVHYVFSTGFTWLKLVLLLFYAYGGDMTGVLVCLALAWYAAGAFGGSSAAAWIREHRWIGVFFISQGVLFLMQYQSMISHSWMNRNKWFRGMLWTNGLLLSVEMILVHLILRYLPGFLTTLLGEDTVSLLLCWELHKSGLLGIAFNALWFLRERRGLKREV